MFSIEFCTVVAVSAIAGALIRDWWLIGRHRRRANYPPDWDDIRRAVYRREAYRCQNCGQGNTELHAHHIIPLSVNGTNALSNIACLCRDCHRRIHPHMR